MMLLSFKMVFSRAGYVISAVMVASAVFALSTWLPNLGLIWQVVTSQSASALDKLAVLGGLLASITTNFTVFSALYTIAIAILFGINVSMVAYYIRQRRKFVQQGGIAASAGGLLSGLLGIGCAACGTLVLGPIISVIGAGGLIVLLPLGGQEFGILGVSILAVSIFFTVKKIQDPLVCEVSKPKQQHG